MRKPCNYPACRALIENGAYCAEHADKAQKRHRIYDERVRASDPALAIAAAIRSSPRWKRLQRIKLLTNPLCEDPFGQHARRQVTETATQVHHIKGLATNPGLAYDMDNLMSVCTRCHARIEREVRSCSE